MSPCRSFVVQMVVDLGTGAVNAGGPDNAHLAGGRTGVGFGKEFQLGIGCGSSFFRLRPERRASSYYPYTECAVGSGDGL